jgi:acyl-CoA synthetase (AMP-forming)/AMP-acid ligase II
MGLIACAVLPAVAGVPVTALSPFHWVTRPATLLRAIHDDRCTLAWLPNFAYDFLATRVRDSQIEGVRLDTMRAFINCSEPTLARSHRRFLERYAPLGVREDALWTCYAAAETTFAISQSTAAFPPRVESIDRERFLSAGDAAPVTDSDGPSMEMLSGGSVLPGTEVRIVDAEGRELPDRRVGEIAIRSTSLFSGYLKQPDETAQVLRDGWYDSGDLGYQADGHLFVTGRKKDLIIVAGRNYYPQDVECIVSEVRGIHPGRVVALGVDDAAIGTQRLVVLAEIEDPGLLDSVELAGRVRTAVAEDLDCAIDDLRLLPHMWLLKTSSGKIARRPSLERYLQELPPSR